MDGMHKIHLDLNTHTYTFRLVAVCAHLFAISKDSIYGMYVHMCMDSIHKIHLNLNTHA